MDEKTKERLRRLKAMADDASNENEAMIAARRLHALLAKHGMDESEIDDGDGVNWGDQNTLLVRGEWCQEVMFAIARLYFCKGLTHGQPRFRRPGEGAGKRFTLVGRELHRETATRVIQSVVRSVYAEAKRSSREVRPKRIHPMTWITSFCEGASYRIRVRVHELIEAGRKGDLEDEDGAQLPVLASMYDTAAADISALLADTKIGAFRPKGQVQSVRAFSNGEAFGHGVALGHELAQHTPNALMHDTEA
ncbi:DUF2786 domain-containing protein [Halomonas elongata]|uniref:DUF2786 domain-containing protein n=1 Tax=Halomonas elongata TaxID=2746 RepID=UPI00335F1E30